MLPNPLLSEWYPRLLPSALMAVPALTMLDSHLLKLLEHLQSCLWAGAAPRKAETFQATYFLWWKLSELSRDIAMVLIGNAKYINKETEQRIFWTRS